MPLAVNALRRISDNLSLGPLTVGARRWTRQLLRQPFHRDYRLLRAIQPTPGQVIIDAGAFDGASIEAIRLYHPDTPLLAFEPNPRRALVLADLFGEDANLSIYACGLADREGDAVLAAPLHGGSLRDREASFDARRVRQWGPVRSVKTRVFPIDSLDANVAVLKLSVNGSERAVLEGARETLIRCEPLILCALDEAADAYLTGELGWIRAGFDGTRLVPGEVSDRHGIYMGPRCEAVLWRAGLVA